MDKKVLKKEVNELLKAGKTKQETYELLVNAYEYSDYIAEIIQYSATKQTLKKYGFLNYILQGISVITFISINIYNFQVFTAILSALLVYTVFTKDYSNYIWISSIMLFGSLGLVAAVALEEFNAEIDLLRKITVIACVIVLVLLPFIITSIYCKQPIRAKEILENEDGSTTWKNKYTFID